PFGPSGPGSPSGPSGPSGPGSPSGPCGPSGPFGPSGPCGPSGPSGPGSPLITLIGRGFSVDTYFFSPVSLSKKCKLMSYLSVVSVGHTTSVGKPSCCGTSSSACL